MDFPQNSHSLFGKSRPDFAFKKMDQLNHDITGIIVLDKFLEQVSGSMIEFKLDVSNDNLPQAFANMVRVGNDL